jgi:hypothetical protein
VDRRFWIAIRADGNDDSDRNEKQGVLHYGASLMDLSCGMRLEIVQNVYVITILSRIEAGG